MNATNMGPVDTLITEFDKGLRTVFAQARSSRPHPDRDQPEAVLEAPAKKHVAGLMRVNHSGEVCAQALYNGQALTARSSATQAALRQASDEETEHLAWCEKRLDELGSHKSLLNPVFYAGSFVLGALAGALGDKWSLGFLAETERQVGNHLEGHLGRLPPQDDKSRAILQQMQIDEARHATTAMVHGAAELPAPVRFAMRLSSKMMTNTTYWI